MSKHTPEPWAVSEEMGCGCTIVDAEGYLIGYFDRQEKGSTKPAHEESKANAARAVACIQACEGLDPQFLPDTLHFLRQALNVLDGTGSIDKDAAKAMLARLKQEST